MVQVDGVNPERVGSGARGMAPYQAYECKDGYLVVSAPNDNLFDRLCPAVGLPELLNDPRFGSNQDRYSNLVELNTYLKPVFAVNTRDHWMEILHGAGVPCAPVRRISEMLDDEQTQAIGILQSLPGQSPELVGLPLSFDGERPALRSMAPENGEHTEMIRGSKT